MRLRLLCLWLGLAAVTASQAPPVPPPEPVEWSLTVVTEPLAADPARPWPHLGDLPLHTESADPPVGWSPVLNETFDTPLLDPPCNTVSDDSNDGYQRHWGHDLAPPANDSPAHWPAAGGADAVSGHYPPHMQTGRYCGYFDLRQADKVRLQFRYRARMADPDDTFRLVMVSAETGQLLAQMGFTPDTEGGWRVRQQDVLFQLADPTPLKQVWLGLWFESDGDNAVDEGIWVDDLLVLQYRQPEQTCGDLDPGPKGLNLPAFDPRVDADNSPIIRAGDTTALERADWVQADWVRLLFKLPDPEAAALDLLAYDYIIDNLCDRGISVLGLVNNESLARQDFYDNMGEYKLEYGQLMHDLATYYEGRITHWEVWNEPNLTEYGTEPPQPSVIAIRPEDYADPLAWTYPLIKEANPQAQVITAGLSGAWDNSVQYFEVMYDRIDALRQNDPTLGDVYDYIGLHPYPDGRVEYSSDYHGVDPAIYLLAVEPPFTNHLFEPFLWEADQNGDEDKQIWITEIGWQNFDPNDPKHPDCLNHVVVSEAEQAQYLHNGLDFMLDGERVHLWNQPDVPAIDKVFWYQLMDIGQEVKEGCIDQSTLTDPALLRAAPPPDDEEREEINWWFGLYGGHLSRAKPSACAFLAYPQSCEEYFDNQLYLPVIRRK